MSTTEDLILVGGGLANGLLAYRLAMTRPEIRLLLLERGNRLGGDHTWSFHTHDLTAEQREWVRPFVRHSWERHEVRFPGLARTLDSGYHSTTSEALHDVLSESLGDRIRTGADVERVERDRVTLSDGTSLSAHAVIDGRGPLPSPHLELGYQKFVGQVLTLDAPHGLDGPILMDATVEQRDGFRFVYTLPFAEDRLLVEDTRYSDTPTLDDADLREAVTRYVAEQGWSVRRVEREERGVLPIVLDGDIDAFWNDGAHGLSDGVPRSGLRAGLFHPTTGYSLAEAVRLADDIAGAGSFDSASLRIRIQDRSREAWRRDAFLRFLNRMLFRAAEPDRRYRVLRHFYTKSEPMIRRFYAGRLSSLDRVRLLTGVPPVPIRRAARCIAPARREASTVALMEKP